MKKISTPYEFEGRIPLAQAIPLGLQHVMAMFIGNLTPLIIVMGLCGLTADADNLVFVPLVGEEEYEEIIAVWKSDNAGQALQKFVLRITGAE